jgi:hypothetical protein
MKESDFVYVFCEWTSCITNMFLLYMQTGYTYTYNKQAGVI